MEEGSLAVLVDAKTEYTHQFIHVIKPSVYKCISNLFIKSRNEKFVLKKFQEELSLIHLWNQHVIDTEYETILKLSGCDWLDELITAVFVSHTRILTSINMNKEKGKINLKIPKTSNFIHKCYINVARHIWKTSYLFNDRVSNYEKQKNRRECELIIEQAIVETIRKEIPLKDILKEYLGNDYRTPSSPVKKLVINKIETYSEEALKKLQSVLDDVDVVPTKVEPKVEPKVEAKVEPKVDKENLDDMLNIEELDMDTLKNLNNYEEVYLDEPVEIKTISKEPLAPEDIDIKRISITDKNNKKMTELVNIDGVVITKDDSNLLNKYKEKSSYKFF